MLNAATIFSLRARLDFALGRDIVIVRRSPLQSLGGPALADRGQSLRDSIHHAVVPQCCLHANHGVGTATMNSRCSNYPFGMSGSTDHRARHRHLNDGSAARATVRLHYNQDGPAYNAASRSMRACYTDRWTTFGDLGLKERSSPHARSMPLLPPLLGAIGATSFTRLARPSASA